MWWKFLFWITCVGPIVMGLYMLLKWTVLGITWPIRWGWRKLRGKNKYLKELEALKTKDEFHRWQPNAIEAFGLSVYESTPNVLYEASGRKRSVYDKMCKQVIRLFDVHDDWGADSGNHFFWE